MLWFIKYKTDHLEFLTMILVTIDAFEFHPVTLLYAQGQGYPPACKKPCYQVNSETVHVSWSNVLGKMFIVTWCKSVRLDGRALLSPYGVMPLAIIDQTFYDKKLGTIDRRDLELPPLVIAWHDLKNDLKVKGQGQLL